MNKKLAISIILGINFFSLPFFANAYCPPYFAHIDSIETGSENINCLKIKATNGCGGELWIENNCSQPFYLEEKEIGSGNSLYYSGEKMDWLGSRNEELINKGYIDWTLNGKLEENDIIIKGRTAYGKMWPELIVDYLPIAFMLMLVLLFLKQKYFKKNKLIFILIIINVIYILLGIVFYFFQNYLAN